MNNEVLVNIYSDDLTDLFPASAGLNRRKGDRRKIDYTVPRVSGAESGQVSTMPLIVFFSLR